jgi:capsular exopolysaccharide synthesis family protein
MINLCKVIREPESSLDEVSSASGRVNSNGLTCDLASVPVIEVSVRPESRVALLTDPQDVSADRFRFLRMRLRDLKSSRKLQSLVVTSALPKDGKSTVALNLATALAEGGKRSVLLIDGDLHHPTLAASLGIEVQPGLAECFECGVDPLSAIRRLEPLSWYLLQSGTPKGNPTDFLQTDALAEMMVTLSSQFDWILVDTPPVAPLTDALSISRRVDGTLLVVRAGVTPRTAIDEAIELLGQQHLLGIVFNGAEGLDRRYKKYHKYYGRK